MTKKIEEFILRECPGMILSEYREPIIVNTYETLHYRGSKPEIDAQEWECIMRVLMESFGMRTLARFRLYHPYEDCAVIGIVDRVDGYTRTFTVDGEQFKMADIIGAKAL